jgi:hypothetical protein
MEEGHSPDGLQEQQQGLQQEQQQSLLMDVLFDSTIEKEQFGDHVLEVSFITSDLLDNCRRKLYISCGSSCLCSGAAKHLAVLDAAALHWHAILQDMSAAITCTCFNSIYLRLEH